MEASQTVEQVEQVEPAPDPWSPDGLILRAEQLHGARRTILGQQESVRTMLRAAKDGGTLTPEQVAKVDALFPPRERKSKDNEAAAGGPDTPTPAASGRKRS